ncbi:MAG: hypothetical protein AB7V00_02715 [Bacilli bacterium]
MCDTLFKKTKTTAFFGKNSDRSANEPNLCLYYPQYERKINEKGTYISIGNANSIHSLLLIQPSWIWGGEMGINDCGVVIGNEATFTKSSNKKDEHLLGMDLLRLGLEQSSNAKEAVDTIIHYLDEYGQGGNCGFDKHFYYDNSYLITDGENSYILETVVKNWVLKEITDSGNISNRLTIEKDYIKGSKTYSNFRKQNTEPVVTYFSQAKTRQKTVYESLKQANDLRDIMGILTSHHPKDEKRLFTKGSIRSVCMHQSLLGDHTTSSMIVHFHKHLPTIWLTGASSPCLSIYKPCFLGINVPPVFVDKESSYQYWLERELLARAIFGRLIAKDQYLQKAHDIQEQFIKEEEALFAKEPTKDQLVAFASKCSNIEQAFVDSFKKEIDIIKQDYRYLPKLWQKKMPSLGNNVFMTDFKERNNG